MSTLIANALAFETCFLSACKSRLSKIHRAIVRGGMARTARELDARGFHAEAQSIRNELRYGKHWQ